MASRLDRFPESARVCDCFVVAAVEYRHAANEARYGARIRFGVFDKKKKIRAVRRFFRLCQEYRLIARAREIG